MATHTYNSRVYYDSDGIGTYTELVGPVDVQFPDIAATNCPSDTLVDLVKTTVAGKVDVGKMTITMLFDKTVFNTMTGLFRTNYYWRAQWPDASPVTNGSKIEFQGYIDMYTPPQMDDDNCLKWSLSVKLNSLPTFTAAT